MQIGSYKSENTNRKQKPIGNYQSGETRQKHTNLKIQIRKILTGKYRSEIKHRKYKSTNTSRKIQIENKNNRKLLIGRYKAETYKSENINRKKKSENTRRENKI